MKYWNEKLRNAQEYVPGEQPENLEEYIKLNTNENPFAPSASVLEKIRKACNENLRRYPDPYATEIRELFATQNKINANNVFVANGSDEIFTLIFRGFIEPGGVAAFAYPSYSLYDTLAQINGIHYEKVNLRNDFTYDMKLFLKKKYNLVIIANPNNPTGTWCDISEIDEFLKKFKGLLVIDEAYVDFYNNSALELIKKYDNIIITRSFSKSYSLAGLRVGLAIAQSNLIQGFYRIKDSYNVDMLAIAGAKAALEDQKNFKYNTRMTINNKEYLEERLGDLGFKIVPSQANFIFTKHDNVASEQLYLKLKEKKVLVRYFPGPIRSEYIRISVGTMMELKVLIKELTAILEDV